METWVVVSSIFLWIVVLLNLVFTLALIRRVNDTSGSSLPVETGPAIGEEAPNFATTTLAGETVTVGDYAGHPVTFLFVAPHCQPCHELIKNLSPQLREANTALVLVCNGSRQETETMARELDIHLPLLLAPRLENPLFETYKISATPSYCSLDEQGIVRAKGIPGPSEQHCMVDPFVKTQNQANQRCLVSELTQCEKDHLGKLLFLYLKYSSAGV